MTAVHEYYNDYFIKYNKMLVRLFYKTLCLKMNSENGLADRYLEKEELEKSFQSCLHFNI